jgi:hypothetical protein
VPFVIGAVLDLGRCLNLLDSSGLREVRDAQASLAAGYARLGRPMPKNTGGAFKAARMLDRLVINSLHDFRGSVGQPPYDSVRAMFPEGGELYAEAGFREKNHIQICVRNPACIKAISGPSKARKRNSINSCAAIPAQAGQ